MMKLWRMLDPNRTSDSTRRSLRFGLFPGTGRAAHTSFSLLAVFKRPSYLSALDPWLRTEHSDVGLARMSWIAMGALISITASHKPPTSPTLSFPAYQ
jgi:hypothetical protein